MNNCTSIQLRFLNGNENTMSELGTRFTGGVNSLYIWFECSFGMKSCTFFDFILEKAGVVDTPGGDFGKNDNL